MKMWMCLILFIATGCAQMRVNLAELALKPGGQTPPTPTMHEERIDTFLWGLWTAKPAPSESQICGASELQRLEMRMATSDVLLTSVTLGLYVPHRAKYVCVSSNR